MYSSRDNNACRLYLVQHGQAEADSGYSGRPLTEVGKDTTEHVAAWASRIGLSVGEIWHSGKPRAKQTAEIFAKKLRPSGGVVLVEGINPNDDVEQFAKQLENLSKSVMLVGHLPFLDRLAGLLVVGDLEQSVVRFSNSAVVGLERQDARWVVFCTIPPGVLG